MLIIGSYTTPSNFFSFFFQFPLMFACDAAVGASEVLVAGNKAFKLNNWLTCKLMLITVAVNCQKILNYNMLLSPLVEIWFSNNYFIYTIKSSKNLSFVVALTIFTGENQFCRLQSSWWNTSNAFHVAALTSFKTFIYRSNKSTFSTYSVMCVVSASIL